MKRKGEIGFFGIFLTFLILLVLVLYILSLVNKIEKSEFIIQTSPLVEGVENSSVLIDLNSLGVPVNRLLLGNNIEWVDSGGGLLLPSTTDFDPLMLELSKELNPSALRFPGGLNAEGYHWKDGLGNFSDRGINTNQYTKGNQTVTFGTVELLEFARETGAEPFIAVNTVSGNSTEAAEWVKAINIDGIFDSNGTRFQNVTYWEIGNEPYLISDSNNIITPEEYGTTVNEFIREMKSVDPMIKVGIALRNDYLGVPGIPVTNFVNFSRRVLSVVNESFEFISVHNAYLPYVYTTNDSEMPPDEDLYVAAVSAVAVVLDDLNNTRDLLKEFYPIGDFEFIISEYNAFYKAPNFETVLNSSTKDGYIMTITSGIYITDLITNLLNQEDVIMANYWSISDNWFFGSIAYDGQKMPSYHVLSELSKVLNGKIIKTEVNSTRFDNLEIGAVPAKNNTSILSVTALRNGNNLSIILINKAINKSNNVTIYFDEDKEISFSSLRVMGENENYFDAGNPFDPLYNGSIGEFKNKNVSFVQTPFSIELLPHSVGILTLGIIEPTCFDSIQNQDETGVDCGGAICQACPKSSGGGDGGSSKIKPKFPPGNSSNSTTGNFGNITFNESGFEGCIGEECELESRTNSEKNENSLRISFVLETVLKRPFIIVGGVIVIILGFVSYILFKLYRKRK